MKKRRSVLNNGIWNVAVVASLGKLFAVEEENKTLIRNENENK